MTGQKKEKKEKEKEEKKKEEKFLRRGRTDRPIEGSTRGPHGPKNRSLPPTMVSYWYLHPKEMFMRLVFCLFETQRCVKDNLEGHKNEVMLRHGTGSNCCN